MKNPSSKSDAGTLQVQPVTPRLLDVTGSAFYLGVGVQTIRDWHEAELLEVVPVPGAKLRKDGQIVAGPRRRRMSKLLFDVEDLDAFVDQLKRNGGPA